LKLAPTILASPFPVLMVDSALMFCSRPANVVPASEGGSDDDTVLAWGRCRRFLDEGRGVSGGDARF
jgi:hypothetical protein